MYRRIAVTAVLLSAAASPALAQNAGAQLPPAAAAGTQLTRLPADSVAIARRFVGWLWSTQVDSLLAHSPPDTAMTRDVLTNQISQIVGQIGVEQEVVEERWVRRNGKRQYWRKAVYSIAPEPVLLRLVILPDGSLGGIGLGLASQPPPIDPEQ